MELSISFIIFNRRRTYIYNVTITNIRSTTLQHIAIIYIHVLTILD